MSDMTYSYTVIGVRKGYQLCIRGGILSRKTVALTELRENQGKFFYEIAKNI